MYTRVSSEEQAKEGYSIPHQRQRIREYARRNRLDVRERFEEAHSAKQAGRPEFRRMLAFLEAHREVRTVLVHKQDRIARNLTDWAYLCETLAVRVVAVEEPVADTPMGWLTQTFGAAMAKYYSDNLSHEVRKGLRQKFEDGGCLTRAPIGYRNVPRGRGTRASVVVDEEKATLVRQMFERFATGSYSLAALAGELADLGLLTKSGKPYPKERIRRLLRHPFYKGCAVYRGEVRPGTHEALVPVSLWDDVQAVLARRHTDTGEKGSKFFLLRGLLWCGTCGHRFTAEAHPRGVYYRCVPDARRTACTERYVSAPALEAAVEELLARVVIPEDRRRDVLDALAHIEDEQRRVRERDEAGLRSRADHLRARILRLSSSYADGVMPEADYVALRGEADAQLWGVTERLEALSRDLSGDVEAVRALLARATAIPELYAATASPEDRKALLAEVFARIVVQDRQIVRIEYNPPFELLLASSPASAGSRSELARALLDRMAGNEV
ncbi:MAG: recombinase family protein [Myxococcota bacterium]